MKQVIKSSLSPQQQKLVKLMQKINFGRIEDIRIREGQPVLDPPPRVVRLIKFGGENGCRPESARADFKLKTEVRDMFGQMEAVGDGHIHSLEIQRGLPFRMTVEEVRA